MALHILLGKAYQEFLVFAHIRLLLAIGTLQAAVLCPAQSRSKSPARMNGIQKALAGAVVEHCFQKFELLVRVAQSVAMTDKEYLVVDFYGLWLVVYYHTALFFQIAVCPHIVVAGKEMHFHSHIRQFREFAQEPGIAFRYYIFILVPEIKHISQQIDGCSLMLDAVEETYESAFLHSAVRDCPRAEMRIRKEIYIFHKRFFLSEE